MERQQNTTREGIPPRYTAKKGTQQGGRSLSLSHEKAKKHAKEGVLPPRRVEK
jgi:hypothetical protein